MVIDPGKDAAPGVADVVREHRLKPVAVLLTHGHIDHMWSVTPVAGAYDATAWIHPGDRHLLTDPMAGISKESASMLLGGDYEFTEPDDVAEPGRRSRARDSPGCASWSTTPRGTPRDRSPSARRGRLLTGRTSPR
ncbi:MBL fold metallo-hydrolase [Nocardioides convexus]|uniref:MBL fold metallo-hydrolase n=1 Tax=Nocardioides convexus TaxID=2712224 RepID=UPI0024186BBF|nr:MBL fold metallo-hydrolase [Nocardioides convexus]